MKNYFQKHLLAYLLLLVLVGLFVLGGVYSNFNQAQLDDFLATTTVTTTTVTTTTTTTTTTATNDLNMHIVGYARNYDVNTFIAAPYVVNITYGTNSDPARVTLDTSFQIVNADGVPQDVQTLLQTSINAGHPVFTTTVGFVSYDSETFTLVARTYGFHDWITVTLVLDSSFVVQSYSVSSSESYDEPNSYQGSPVPAVEEYFIDSYIGGDSTPDAVAGASITSTAMQQLVTLLDAFLQAQGGQ